MNPDALNLGFCKFDGEGNKNLFLRSYLIKSVEHITTLNHVEIFRDVLAIANQFCAVVLNSELRANVSARRASAILLI